MHMLADVLRIMMLGFAALIAVSVGAPLGGAVLGHAVVSLPLRLRNTILISPSPRADWWEFWGTFLLTINSFLVGLNLYLVSPFSYFDIPLHFSGGIIAGVWATLAFPEITRNLRGVILILGITALIGVGWEFLEWGATQAFGLRYRIWFQGNLNDTMGDLLLDLLGGGLAAFFFFRKKERR